MASRVCLQSYWNPHQFFEGVMQNGTFTLENSLAAYRTVKHMLTTTYNQVLGISPREIQTYVLVKSRMHMFIVTVFTTGKS